MRSSHCHHQGWHGKLCAYCYLSSSETFPIHQNISKSYLLLTYRGLFIHNAYPKQALSKLSFAASFLQVSVSMQNLLSPPTPPTTTIRVISYPKDLPSLGKTNIQYATKYKLVYVLPCAMSAVARPNVCTSVKFRSRNGSIWQYTWLHVSYKNMDFILYRFSSEGNANFTL